MTDPLDIIEQAHAVAQARFRDMVNARSYADPKAPETVAYLRAERAVDVLLMNAQFAHEQGELDALAAGEYPANVSYHDWQARS